MAINPPSEPEPETPQWVKDLFGRLADKIESVEQKVSNNNVQAPHTSAEGESGTAKDTNAGSDTDTSGDTERKPKRRRSWIFRD